MQKILGLKETRCTYHGPGISDPKTDHVPYNPIHLGNKYNLSSECSKKYFGDWYLKSGGLSWEYLLPFKIPDLFSSCYMWFFFDE